MTRYSIIHEKNPREILLLRGKGCRWRKCLFCDYHLDCSHDENANLALNRDVMSKVTGLYNHLEVINSGSFTELGETLLFDLAQLCSEKNIRILHFECHWLYRNEIPRWRKIFACSGTTLKIKTGVESFDYDFRENVLRKGISEHRPEKIAENFDECCLLFGLTGQTEESMRRDIETGLEYFERICINIFIKNKTVLEPDENVISIFRNKIMPDYICNNRVDILMNNTDFGVGGE
ncbi:MAG: radical SAM protein [Oscillospiraceae bacterium]|nr:radical SAM protein [Oscillospiraceae bacterium]